MPQEFLPSLLRWSSVTKGKMYSDKKISFQGDTENIGAETRPIYTQPLFHCGVQQIRLWIENVLAGREA
jgi:hypothetical protein